MRFAVKLELFARVFIGANLLSFSFFESLNVHNTAHLLSRKVFQRCHIFGYLLWNICIDLSLALCVECSFSEFLRVLQGSTELLYLARLKQRASTPLVGKGGKTWPL